MNKILFFMALLLVLPMASAQTQFIKYKNYLIPIGGATGVTTAGFSNVDNTSVTLELVLERGQEGALVWFEFGTSNLIQCANPERSPFSSRMNINHWAFSRHQLLLSWMRAQQ